MLSEAATSVDHSHGWERTKARPSRSAPCSASSVAGAGSERTRSAQMQAALTANVAASTRNALPGPMRCHDEAADRRPEQLLAGLAHELVKRVGLDELLRRHDLGDQRAERRPEERLAGAVEDREDHEVPDLQRSGERQHPDHGDDQRAPDVGARSAPAAARRGR